MGEPYVKLYKKMLKWEWYDDTNTKILFLHILLRANWEPGSWHGIDYEAGEFITSLETLSVETHLSIQQIRTALKHLISTGEITSKQQGRARIITVNNWCQYQGGNKVSNSKVTGSQQGPNKVVTTDKEYKEYKEEKNKYYDDAKLDKAFSDYVAARKQMKKPMTDHAIDLAKKKLDELSGGNTDTAVKIIEQSILGGWQGLFPLKQDQKKTKFSNFTGRKYNFDELEGEAYGSV